MARAEGSPASSETSNHSNQNFLQHLLADTSDEGESFGSPHSPSSPQDIFGPPLAASGESRSRGRPLVFPDIGSVPSPSRGRSRGNVGEASSSHNGLPGAGFPGPSTAEYLPLGDFGLGPPSSNSSPVLPGLNEILNDSVDDGASHVAHPHGHPVPPIIGMERLDRASDSPLHVPHYSLGETSMSSSMSSHAGPAPEAMREPVQPARTLFARNHPGPVTTNRPETRPYVHDHPGGPRRGGFGEAIGSLDRFEPRTELRGVTATAPASWEGVAPPFGEAGTPGFTGPPGARRRSSAGGTFQTCPDEEGTAVDALPGAAAFVLPTAGAVPPSTAAGRMPAFPASWQGHDSSEHAPAHGLLSAGSSGPMESAVPAPVAYGISATAPAMGSDGLAGGGAPNLWALASEVAAEAVLPPPVLPPPLADPMRTEGAFDFRPIPAGGVMPGASSLGPSGLVTDGDAGIGHATIRGGTMEAHPVTHNGTSEGRMPPRPAGFAADPSARVSASNFGMPRRAPAPAPASMGGMGPAPVAPVALASMGGMGPVPHGLAHPGPVVAVAPARAGLGFAGAPPRVPTSGLMPPAPAHLHPGFGGSMGVGDPMGGLSTGLAPMGGLSAGLAPMGGMGMPTGLAPMGGMPSGLAPMGVAPLRMPGGVGAMGMAGVPGGAMGGIPLGVGGLPFGAGCAMGGPAAGFAGAMGGPAAGFAGPGMPFGAMAGLPAPVRMSEGVAPPPAGGRLAPAGALGVAAAVPPVAPHAVPAGAPGAGATGAGGPGAAFAPGAAVTPHGALAGASGPDGATAAGAAAWPWGPGGWPPHAAWGPGGWPPHAAWGPGGWPPHAGYPYPWAHAGIRPGPPPAGPPPGDADGHGAGLPPPGRAGPPPGDAGLPPRDADGDRAGVPAAPRVPAVDALGVPAGDVGPHGGDGAGDGAAMAAVRPDAGLPGGDGAADADAGIPAGSAPVDRRVPAADAGGLPAGDAFFAGDAPRSPQTPFRPAHAAASPDAFAADGGVFHVGSGDDAVPVPCTSMVEKGQQTSPEKNAIVPRGHQAKRKAPKAIEPEAKFRLIEVPPTHVASAANDLPRTRHRIRVLEYWNGERQVFEKLPGAATLSLKSVIIKQDIAPPMRATRRSLNGHADSLVASPDSGASSPVTPAPRRHGAAKGRGTATGRAGRAVVSPDAGRAIVSPDVAPSVGESMYSCAEDDGPQVDDPVVSVGGGGPRGRGGPGRPAARRQAQICGCGDRLKPNSDCCKRCGRSREEAEAPPPLMEDDEGFVDAAAPDGSLHPCKVRMGLNTSHWLCCDILIPPRSFNGTEHLEGGRSLLLTVLNDARGLLFANIDGSRVALRCGDCVTIPSGSNYSLMNDSQTDHAGLKLVLISSNAN